MEKNQSEGKPSEFSFEYAQEIAAKAAQEAKDHQRPEKIKEKTEEEKRAELDAAIADTDRRGMAGEAVIYSPEMLERMAEKKNQNN